MPRRPRSAGSGAGSPGRAAAGRAPRRAGERSGDPEAAREAALRLLERTRRTRGDLARRLREKGFEPQVVEQVLDRLGEVGLVDDLEYALAYLAGRRGRRTAGWRRLEQDLRRRGVGAEDIAAARGRLEEEQDPVDDTAAARRVLLQAARRYAGLDPHARRRRLYALLARRGFDGVTIERVLREEGAGTG